jgi:PhzF family phenazine biosynthesis protein
VTRHRIRHVDAFTSTPLEGNPAAVVDGASLDGATMQRIALNQKLSETVFLLPPDSAENHARIRIFTPTVELPFAGHPTLAAAHALISEGNVKLREGEALRIETGAGVVPVEVRASSPMYTMTQVAPEFRDSKFAPDDIASWIGLGPGDVLRAEYVSTGIFWLIAQVASLDAVRRAKPDLAALRANDDVSIFCTDAEDSAASIRVRTFAPNRGVEEDPITGSSNGCIGAFIARHGLLPERDGEIAYVAEQGLEMGQPGRVHVRVSGGAASPVSHVGGDAVTVLVGDLLL